MQGIILRTYVHKYDMKVRNKYVRLLLILLLLFWATEQGYTGKMVLLKEIYLVHLVFRAHFTL